VIGLPTRYKCDRPFLFFNHPRESAKNDPFLTIEKSSKNSKKRVIFYEKKSFLGSKIAKSSRKTRKTHFSHQKSRNSRWRNFDIQRARLGTEIHLENSAREARGNFF